jgi:hypothetical protein
MKRAMRLHPRWLLIAGWGLVIVYAFPGYMNWDASEQLWQGRNHALQDWHPPLMAAYWSVLDQIVRGPLLMLLLQTGLWLWSLYTLLRLRFSERTSAIAATLLLLFPPMMTTMTGVWKDAQMVAFVLAGTLLAMQPRRWQRGLGCLLLVLGTGVRDNAPAALPPLCLLIASAWQLRTRWHTWGAALGMFVAIVIGAVLANRAVPHEPVFPWYKTVAVHDFAGTVCREDRMSDDEVRALFEGVKLLPAENLQGWMCLKYETRVWFALNATDDNPSVFAWTFDDDERRARRRAWFRLVTTHTHAYLSHRWALMRELLGLTDSEPWEPVINTFTANKDQGRRLHHEGKQTVFQRWTGQLIRTKLSTTILFRPWAYALVGFALLGYAARRRDKLVAALVGSGLLYELGYFVAAAAPDWRYSHWMVSCVTIAAAIVFGERWRAGARAGTII